MNRTTNSFAACIRMTILWAIASSLIAPGILDAATIFSTRAAFESSVGRTITDDYEAAAYRTSDIPNTYTDRYVHSNASVSAVFGETRYKSTGFEEYNLIVIDPGNHFYCAGCNGSYETDFTATSFRSPAGVYGVGFDIPAGGTVEYPIVFGTYAFVTYGDNTNESIPVPSNERFWGITSGLLIRKIHFGLRGGGVNENYFVQRMAMDNLTIAGRVPEPTGLMLLLVALASMPLVQKCVAPRRVRRPPIAP